jgi:antitoxin VapB
MAINIKNREVEALLAEIRAATGKGPSRVVLELLRREVDQLRRQRQVGRRRRRIAAISKRYRARLKARRMSPDDIIGYDADGLPS